ncbi:MAG: hypothetical protein AAGG48_26680 [Planctomycetota bacterium]
MNVMFQAMSHPIARYFAVACFLGSVFVVLRAFSKDPNSGKRRIGFKSVAFLVFTVLLVLAIRYGDKHRIERAYELVRKTNRDVSASDAKYRAANSSFRTSFELYRDSFRSLEPGSDFQGDLIAIGEIAKETRALGEALEERYAELSEISAAYQVTLTNASGTYALAQSTLDWATEEDALLYRSKMIQELAKNEEYAELGLAYEELAEVFEKLARNSTQRANEIEVNTPELAKAMSFVERANAYLKVVEFHSNALGGFESPDQILRDMRPYKDGVNQVISGIHELNVRLDQVDVTEQHVTL